MPPCLLRPLRLLAHGKCSAEKKLKKSGGDEHISLPRPLEGVKDFEDFPVVFIPTVGAKRQSGTGDDFKAVAAGMTQHIMTANETVAAERLPGAGHGHSVTCCHRDACCSHVNTGHNKTAMSARDS